MPEITSFEMMLRSLIIALPLLVLTVLFFLLAAKRRRTTDAARPEKVPAPVQDHAVDKAPAAPASHGAATAPVPAAPEPIREPPRQPAEPSVRSPAGSGQQISPVTTLSRVAQLEADIAKAEEAGATVALAELYLALGRAHMADGAEGEALSALRSAAGLAALHKAPKVQALARIDLAEVAMSHGDPTTACEHWQMARMAFLDAGDRAEGDKIDRRMRAQGCPTDWVLTDF